MDIFHHHIPSTRVFIKTRQGKNTLEGPDPRRGHVRNLWRSRKHRILPRSAKEKLVNLPRHRGASGAEAAGDGDGWQDRVSSSVPTIHLKTLSKFLHSKHTRSLWCNIIRREFNSTGITLAKVRPYPVYAHASNLNISRATRFAFSVSPLRQVNSRKLYLFTLLLLLSGVSTATPN